VPEVVQTRLDAELSAEPAQGLADPVRRERLVASRRPREHEVVAVTGEAATSPSS
jgi:hypothetical protein